MKCFNTIYVALLLAALAVTGCSKNDDKKPAGEQAPAAGESGASAEHSHGSGPNGGVVFDLGSHHAEFTVDHGKKQVTVLVLGDDEKTPTPVAATELVVAIKDTKTKDGTAVPAMTITLMPEGAMDGKASKFVGTDEGIGNVADFEGTVSGEIDGKPAQGEFKE